MNNKQTKNASEASKKAAKVRRDKTVEELVERCVLDWCECGSCKDFMKEGHLKPCITNYEIAASATTLGITTATGKVTAWKPQMVKNIVEKWNEDHNSADRFIELLYGDN